MRRLWSILLTFAVVLCMFSPLTAFATGEGNIDGGGGNMGDATSHGSWNPGNEGVRVTVVRSSDHVVVSTPFDLTNKAPSSSIYHLESEQDPVQQWYRAVTSSRWIYLH